MKRQSLILTGIAALLATAPLMVAAEKIVGGPFAIGVTGRTATIAWVLESDEITLQGPAGTPATSPSLRVQTTTFTALQPNTRYEYNIASQGDSGKGSFKTPPAGAEPFRFFVYGDTRTRHDVHARVVTEILKHGTPDFILHSGDMVENGNNSAQWPVFFGIEKELLRQAAFFPALGNHERNARYFEAIFQEGVSYHSFDWGNSHITVINSISGPVLRRLNLLW